MNQEDYYRKHDYMVFLTCLPYTGFSSFRTERVSGISTKEAVKQNNYN